MLLIYLGARSISLCFIGFFNTYREFKQNYNIADIKMDILDSSISGAETVISVLI